MSSTSFDTTTLAKALSRHVLAHTNAHMCLVCGAGPFCGDHIGRHFSPCFDAHCPVMPSAPVPATSTTASPRMCQPLLPGHGFKAMSPSCLDPPVRVARYTAIDIC
ncbi:Aste57867_9817 [Aphanomyces stellatus]|uniref:Aste57867_9817 protein n=1 Tax=Aphanomyces stellatus TaxID=120398 RepID=A0A485KP35_9STRA|nr:hypothetical protein As57867_009778 [Aphanomyces stellatus]VFT86696.1 Aste57867_9817 [Aphanomyces stellatus]